VHLQQPCSQKTFDQRRAEIRADGVGTLMRNAGPWSGTGRVAARPSAMHSTEKEQNTQGHAGTESGKGSAGRLSQ
jgi:hypothetical protein